MTTLIAVLDLVGLILGQVSRLVQVGSALARDKITPADAQASIERIDREHKEAKTRVLSTLSKTKS